MAIVLRQVIQYIHSTEVCHKCEQGFSNDTKLISKDTGSRYGGKRICYHIACARQINLICPDIWWNRLTKYKRFEYLWSDKTDLEQDEAQDFAQFSYSKLPENIKLVVDIIFMEIEK